jgi:hypothetical protein
MLKMKSHKMHEKTATTPLRDGRSFERWARHHSPKKIMTGQPWQRKFKRPFSRKQAAQVILHSQTRHSFWDLPNYLMIEEILRAQAKLHGVRLIHRSINRQHLHLLVKARQAKALSNFLRSVSGLIARKILKAEKAAAKGIQFWTGRPFSRLVAWGKDYNETQKFVRLDAGDSQIASAEFTRFFSSA